MNEPGKLTIQQRGGERGQSGTIRPTRVIVTVADINPALSKFKMTDRSHEHVNRNKQNKEPQSDVALLLDMTPEKRSIVMEEHANVFSETFQVDYPSPDSGNAMKVETDRTAAPPFCPVIRLSIAELTSSGDNCTYC